MYLCEKKCVLGEPVYGLDVHVGVGLCEHSLVLGTLETQAAHGGLGAA